jgi:uncharacterized protein YbjQ (UPF0145 family)
MKRVIEKKGEKDFILTRVVTRDIVRDSFSGIRNMFGLRLRNYESLIQKHINEMLEEMRLRYNIKWYRISINPLVKGSIMINIYGEYE